MKLFQKPTSKRLVLVLFLATLTACDSAPQGPDESTFKTAMMLEVGSQFNVEEVEIVVHQSIGSPSESRVRTRLEAELTLREPVYAVAGELTVPALAYQHEKSYQVLKLSQPSGSKFRWKGTAESTHIQDRWQVQAIQQDDIAPPIDGKFLADYHGEYLIQGSEEEKDVLTEIQQQQLRAQEIKSKQLQAAAEASRLKAEQQQRQLDALKVLRQSAAGTWKTNTPVLTDNKVFSDKGVTLGYEVTIPDNDILEGMASVTVFSNQPVKGQLLTATFDALYRFEPGNEYFTLSEVEGNDLRLQRQRWYSGKHWNFQLKGKNLQAISQFRRLNIRMDLEKQ